jgi:hypothetical protein
MAEQRRHDSGAQGEQPRVPSARGAGDAVVPAAHRHARRRRQPAPADLDVVASRRDGTMFLHVANTARTRSVRATFQVEGHTVKAARIFEIAADTTVELSYLNSSDIMTTSERTAAPDAPREFPAASVSAVELEIMPKDRLL